MIMLTKFNSFLAQNWLEYKQAILNHKIVSECIGFYLTVDSEIIGQQTVARILKENRQRKIYFEKFNLIYTMIYIL